MERKKHNRKLCVSTTEIVYDTATGRGVRDHRRHRDVIPELRDEIELILKEDWFSGAHDLPFEFVTLSVLYGLEHRLVPHIGELDSEFKNVTLTFEIDIRDVLKVNREEFRQWLGFSMLVALAYFGEQRDLPVEKLLDRMEYYHEKVKQALAAKDEFGEAEPE